MTWLMADAIASSRLAWWSSRPLLSRCPPFVKKGVAEEGWGHSYAPLGGWGPGWGRKGGVAVPPSLLCNPFFYQSGRL